MTRMRVMIDRSFDDYIDSGDENTRAIVAAGGSTMTAIRAVHDFFPNVLWADGSDIGPVPMMAAMNAFMLYLAGVRVTMTGHVVAAFPVLRTALESACYAFMMSRDSALEEVWLRRHRDESSKQACRRAFTSAVKESTAGINEIQPDSGNFILEAYEASIDFGGHPNVRSIFSHVSVTEHPDEHHVHLAGLYHPQAGEVAQALVACIEFGQAIALVLFRSAKSGTRAMADGLERLNGLKELAVSDLSAP